VKAAASNRAASRVVSFEHRGQRRPHVLVEGRANLRRRLLVHSRRRRRSDSGSGSLRMIAPNVPVHLPGRRRGRRRRRRRRWLVRGSHGGGGGGDKSEGANSDAFAEQKPQGRALRFRFSQAGDVFQTRLPRKVLNLMLKLS